MEGKWFVIPDFCSWRRGEYLEEMLNALTAPGERLLFWDRFFDLREVSPEQRRIWLEEEHPRRENVSDAEYQQEIRRLWQEEDAGLEQDKAAHYAVYLPENHVFAGPYRDRWSAYNGWEWRIRDSKARREDWYALPDAVHRRQALEEITVWGRLMITAGEEPDDYALYFDAEEHNSFYLAIHDRAGRITVGLAERFGMKAYTPERFGEL